MIRLANQVVTEVRQRTQQDVCGHRGRKGDPLYDIHRLLLVGEERLSPEFGGCFALCLVRGGLGVTCFHYIAGAGGWWQGLGDSGFVPGAGVCSDGGEGAGL